MTSLQAGHDVDWCTRCEQVTQWNGDECANNCGKVWGYE